MSATQPFSREGAERLLGPAVLAEIRRQVEAAPPLRPELREQLRALFASAHVTKPEAPAAKAA